MNRLAALLLAASMLATTSPVVAATLKPAGTVAADQVRLGDLFDGLSPEQAQRVVTGAPAPGATLTLDAGTLGRIASSHGVSWRPIGPYDTVQLRRDSVEIGADQLRDSLRAALVEQGAAASIDVQLDNRSLSLFLPVGSDVSVRVEKLAYDPVRGRLTADLVTPATGPEQQRQSVTARAIDMVELPVLNRRLAPGEMIGEADLTYITMPRDRLAAGAIIDSADLVGKSTRRAVVANQPVNGRDVREPVIVEKGTLVTIVLQSGAMMLSSQGKALADGSAGELVRIVNTSSGRVIEATVAGPNLVTVRPVSQIAAAQTAGRTAQARASR